MGGGPQCRSHTRRGLQFGAMALAVIERQAVAGEALLARQGQYRGGIESAGKKNDCGLHGRDGSKQAADALFGAAL
ncbi:hypothetical protein SUTH_03126 [Sulfuritalea hydrogenivorans sk43H]|uniref:Uncharacterized protein n=1 Tax=Sulfuritalea hydrogenivorans sk43H TaxID=1223802 RepID=W0SHN0_9PROT|nr:hypothetical protein SUTH_03126 [Sulfuritalea hydrogenivorans sk43H]